MIDSHVHFYDASREGGIGWPDPGSPHFGIRLPGDFGRANPGATCIAVETSRRFRDDDWLLTLASNSPSICGVVLNLQPDQAGYQARLESAAEYDCFVGVRLRPVQSYDWSSSRLMANLKLTAAQGKTIEFGAVNAPLKVQFAKLADRYANTTWVLDHAGHGADFPDPDWRRDMQRIAERPNVVVKATKLGVTLSQRRSLLNELVDLFGGRRLLYGSNWPLSGNDEISAATLDAYRDCLGADSDAFFFANAERAYSTTRPRLI